ncbi:MAG TPA: DUF4325 domain-containing protein [Ignavibacteria bacterium]|nr:DUF4325 domain-containing protein [Ignavibacteria bacterium]
MNKSDLEKIIFNFLDKKETISVNDIVSETGFTRAYIHRKLTELIAEGKVIKTGKGKNTKYLKSDSKRIKKFFSKVHSFKRRYINVNLKEDECLNEIVSQTAILSKLHDNIKTIFEYAFTEIMNNAIEHSNARYINVLTERTKEQLRFEIKDNGIGIFNNLKHKLRLKSIMDAIQNLTKGKFTTDPKRHTGEGIFFTSKIADIFIIKSYGKTLTFNNLLNDVSIKNSKNVKGTFITFVLSADSNKTLNELFKFYTDDSAKFNKSKIWIKLFEQNKHFISRSEAKRVLNGLEKFDVIILDFKNINEIGQGFADEIFRVWQSSHPQIKIMPMNANENVMFMINRAI